ncbi:hypothetical protein BKA63DRAFT_154045 [Paraphoma chrysanthemicola]|nr:hypothetical protein BKA63DRAFT_154045 [Paraphoma chrysanthemicola]
MPRAHMQYDSPFHRRSNRVSCNSSLDSAVFSTCNTLTSTIVMVSIRFLSSYPTAALPVLETLFLMLGTRVLVHVKDTNVRKDDEQLQNMVVLLMSIVMCALMFRVVVVWVLQLRRWREWWVVRAWRHRLAVRSE